MDPALPHRSANELDRTTESSWSVHYSIPSKAFLLGEYGVLKGAPAILFALTPRFHLCVKKEHDPQACQRRVLPDPCTEAAWHSHAPAGRLLNWLESEKLSQPFSFLFWDPFEGAGGLGASSALFGMVYFAYARELSHQLRPSWKAAWKLYRKLCGEDSLDEAVLPSGADLIAQWQGGVTLWNPICQQCSDLWPLVNASRFLIFSATFFVASSPLFISSTTHFFASSFTAS